MSKKKSLVVLMILFVILIPVYFVVINMDDSEDNKTSIEESIVIENIEENDIVSFYVDNSAGKLLFENRNGYFSIKNTENIKLDKKKIEEYVYYISNISAQSVVDSADEQADFGFDNPLSVINIVKKGGTSSTYLLGNKVPTADGYYFKSSENNKIYIINSVRGDKYLCELKSFRASDVITYTEDDIYSFSLKGEGGVFAAEKTKTQTSLAWTVVEPYNKAADTSKISSEIISMLLSYKIFDYVADNVNDFSAYGIGANSKTALVSNNSGEGIKITFGSEKDGFVYFTINSDKSVYIGDKSILSLFNLNPLNFTDRLIFLTNLSSLKNISVSTDSKKYNINFNTSDDEVVSTINNKKLTSKETKSLFSDLFSFMAVGIADNTSASSVLLTLEITENNNVYNKIEFKELSNRNYGSF